MGDYDKKKALVLDGEVSFARAAALGVIVKRPLSAWHFLLPGMFLFDFLRRNSETKRYSEVFLFPRKLALNGALEIIKGEDRKNILSRAEEKMRAWLISLKLDSDRLLQGHMEEIHLLIDHYSKLLRAEGNNYTSLIKGAYKTREQYETYLQQLTTKEQEVDQAIADIHGNAEHIWEQIKAEALQVAELREKEMNRFF
jgi:23S rRNA G2069 N7-methylase RlmK/C1962 C5-methylase RlmI